MTFAVLSLIFGERCATAPPRPVQRRQHHRELAGQGHTVVKGKRLSPLVLFICNLLLHSLLRSWSATPGGVLDEKKVPEVVLREALAQAEERAERARAWAAEAAELAPLLLQRVAAEGDAEGDTEAEATAAAEAAAEEAAAEAAVITAEGQAEKAPKERGGDTAEGGNEDGGRAATLAGGEPPAPAGPAVESLATESTTAATAVVVVDPHKTLRVLLGGVAAGGADLSMTEQGRLRRARRRALADAWGEDRLQWLCPAARLARVRAALACAMLAETDAARRTVPLLLTLQRCRSPAAPSASAAAGAVSVNTAADPAVSRELDLALYAAAMCVRRWGGLVACRVDLQKQTAVA